MLLPEKTQSEKIFDKELAKIGQFLIIDFTQRFKLKT
jgi:hypothetical protein